MTDQQRMDQLVAEHLAAEMQSDAEAAVSVYTDDVEHDVVGWPTGPVQGQASARDFYDQMMTVFTTQELKPVRTLYGDDFCVIEHWSTGLFPHGFMAAPASEHPVSFRMLHVFEFRGEAISRENVWLDTGGILAQLQPRDG